MSGAKNCPETPRQKMIGMMYLVLTAMLALNVSADILNGFTKLRNSMDASMSATKLRTEDVMTNFKAAYEKDGGEKKYGDWWAIAQAVNAASNEFYDYIDHFKLDIINMVDGKKYTSMAECEEAGGVKNNGETTKPHEYALNRLDPNTGRINADEFKERMDHFRTYVTVVESPCLLHKIDIDSKFAHEWEMKVKMMSDLFSTDNVMSTEGEGAISWQRSTFDEMPAGAVLALLTKYQNDIRVAENDLINFMFSAAGSSDFVVNSVTPIVIPTNGEYIMAGQHYRAKIASAMMDTNQVPRVFINGQEIFGGVYDIPVSGVGPKSFSGYMLVGEDTTHYNFTGQYTVGAPSATISNTDLNIMYRGYDNPFSISVPGTSSDKVKVTCAGANVTKSNGMWIIKPTGDANKAVIEVFAEVDGRSVSMGKQEYRVKALPRPDAYFANGENYFDGTKGIPRSVLINPGSRIVADYGPDGLIKAKFTISGFAVKLPSGQEIQCKGDKMDAKALAAIQKLKAGNMVTLRYIKAKGPDGKEVTLRALPLELN